MMAFSSLAVLLTRHSRSTLRMHRSMKVVESKKAKDIASAIETAYEENGGTDEDILWPALRADGKSGIPRRVRPEMVHDYEMLEYIKEHFERSTQESVASWTKDDFNGFTEGRKQKVALELLYTVGTPNFHRDESVRELAAVQRLFQVRDSRVLIDDLLKQNPYTAEVVALRSALHSSDMFLAVRQVLEGREDRESHS